MGVGAAHRPSTERPVAILIETDIAAVALGSRRLSAVRPTEVQAWPSDRGLPPAVPPQGAAGL